MLEARDLSFAYNAGQPDAIVALQGVDLTVAPGELVAVIGHNGSGKSTLAKLLSAILEPTGGSLMVDGIPATPAHVWDVRRRVGMVFQKPDDQLIANTVIDDLAFGPENLGLPRAEIVRRIETTAEALGLTERLHAQISELSPGEKQRVAIAGVLTMQPAYLILDEPTTMVAPGMARQLLALIHQLRQTTELAVLHITHFMHEVVSFDRVVVMDAGRVLMQGTPRDIFAQADRLRAHGLAVPPVAELGRRLVARGVDLPTVVLTSQELLDGLSQTGLVRPALPAPRELPIDQAAPAPTAPPLLDVRDLHFTYLAGTPLAQTALRGIDCQLVEGETLAILGGSQAGKSTLAEFFNGLRKPAPGHVFFEGRDIAEPGFPLGQLRKAVGVVFQQPEAQLLEETVGKDVSYAPRHQGLSPADSRERVAQALSDVGLDYETFRLRYIYALSGGQKRRVALAGVLAAQPRVLILDEPVAGLDPRGRATLAALIANLTHGHGLTIVLIGNAVDELAELAGRAIVLHHGRVVMEGAPRALLRQADRLHALGLELSAPAAIALALRPLFPDLPTDLLSLDELEQALLERLSLHDRSVRLCAED